MAPDIPLDDDQGEPDDRLRPPWEGTPDETDADWRPQRSVARPGAEDPCAAVDPVVLATLAAAADALGRLDARAAAADEAVRDGLLARLALAEAAGWLAHTHAWVHPLDLALRDAGLTAPAALAAFGAGARSLPHTLAQPAGRLAWDAAPPDTLADTDQGLDDALALARLLRRLPGGGPHPFASAATVETLTAFGTRPLAQDRLATWWDAHAPAPASRRSFGARHRAGRAPLPPLLAGVLAAQVWMASGIADQPDPAQALLAGFGRLARQPPVRHVFVPLWGAYPAVGFGDRDLLPTLRAEADRLGVPGGSVAWPAAGLALIAESARSGLRDLDRLEAAAAKGRGVLAGVTDRRSRLPDTLDALLRTPALTPKALAAQLRIVPQTATTLLRTLAGKGVAREVTGRGRFRAFAV